MIKVGATKKTRVIAFTSGKGGVGKTSLSVNLAIALARSGSKVCLFDADMGMANVNIMLGVTPAYTLEHLFTNEKSIQDIIFSGPSGLDIVPGASGFSKCVDLDEFQQRRLVEALELIEPNYDYLIIDTGAGISPAVLHFVAAAQMAAVVITPEPTSLTDAFSLLKVLRRRGYKRKPQVIVNMVQSASRADKIYRRFEAAVKKYIGIDTEFLGSIWMDESIRSSVTLQRPVTMLPEGDPSCKRFYRLADRLDKAFNRGGVPAVSFALYWQKLVERSNARRAKEVIEAKSEEFIPKESITKESITKEATPNESTAPLKQSPEDAWVDLRIKMNQFLQSDNTTPEQVVTLLSSCIVTYGDRLGGAATDLLHGLLQVIDPSELDEDNRVLITQDLERFKSAPKNVLSLKNIPTDEPVLDEKKHRYDEREFGCQAVLVEKIRKSSGQMSLDHLLESIKYTSLVESPGS